jgi:hypothetical protein
LHNDISKNAEFGSTQSKKDYLSAFPQFGQVLSCLSKIKPQFGQVVGWDSPSGAPQAKQLGVPTGLAVRQ